jgi:hypothetical protein
VRGGPSAPLAPLGIPPDVGLAPFAARYCLSDFARATLRNSGLGLMPAGPADVAPVVAGRLARGPAPNARPGARLLASLRTVARLPYTNPDMPVVVLVAAHILDADLRPVLARHGSAGADLGLICVQADESAPDASSRSTSIPAVASGWSTPRWAPSGRFRWRGPATRWSAPAAWRDSLRP